MGPGIQLEAFSLGEGKKRKCEHERSLQERAEEAGDIGKRKAGNVSEAQSQEVHWFGNSKREILVQIASLCTCSIELVLRRFPRIGSSVVATEVNKLPDKRLAFLLELSV